MFRFSADTGLDKVHYTWAGTFVLEALVYLFPNRHFILIDSDCVPTSLFEVEELVRLFLPGGGDPDLSLLGSSERHPTLPNCSLSSPTVDLCTAAVFLCSEMQAEINAGMVIVTSCQDARPHRIDVSAEEMADGLLESRRAYINQGVDKPDFDQAISSGLLWSPLISTVATRPLHWVHAWALLGEWAGHTVFPIPDTASASSAWPRHGTATFLEPKAQARIPPLVTWGRPAFEQGALAPLVFLPATFTIAVLPGDKLFQSKDVMDNLLLAPVTHSFGGAKMEIGHKLRARAEQPPMPLLMALCGTSRTLPQWAGQVGSDFIRGSRIVNQSLGAADIGLTDDSCAVLRTFWCTTEPIPLGPCLWLPAVYQVAVVDLPGSLAMMTGDLASTLLEAFYTKYPAPQFEKIRGQGPQGFASVWLFMFSHEKEQFMHRWRYIVASHPMVANFLDGDAKRNELCIDCTGLGGSPVMETRRAHLLFQCTNRAKVYGPSLAYQDLIDPDGGTQQTTLGRTAHIHEYQMLQLGAWIVGLKAWQRILMQTSSGFPHKSKVDAAEIGFLLTRAAVALGLGQKLPAHRKLPHPGYTLSARLFLLTTLPQPLQVYWRHVLLHASDLPDEMLISSAVLDSTASRLVQIVGHSAGSYTAMLLESILAEDDFAHMGGITSASAIAMPAQLLAFPLSDTRSVRLIHCDLDRLCVWHPTDTAIQELHERKIEVTYIYGSAPWLGAHGHHYGHLNHAQLSKGKLVLEEILDVRGVLPLSEIRRAPLRLMSWLLSECQPRIEIYFNCSVKDVPEQGCLT